MYVFASVYICIVLFRIFFLTKIMFFKMEMNEVNLYISSLFLVTGRWAQY
jgi:hypothetical protein